MKLFATILLLALAPQVQSHGDNPVQKVLSMLSNLEAKIIKEGVEAQKTYDEFAEWCEDRSRNVGFEIKDGKAEVAEQKATIESSTADIASHSAKIEELADSITVDEADLKAATGIREKEAVDFAATEKDLVETIDTLGRAILILEKEMKKGGAAMVQMEKAGNNLVQALSVMVDASLIGSADAQKLTAFVQGGSSDDSDDDDQGAPAAAVYKGHAGGIIDTLEGLLDKAKDSLEKARNTETNNKHNFEMLKQSLEDEIKFATKDLGETKKALAGAQQTKATAEGDLSVASKGLEEDEATLKTLHQDCLEKSQDFEAETKSRGEKPVTIMVYTIGGDLILGPAMYPSSVKASQLKTDLAAHAGAKNKKIAAKRVKLMLGDKVLGWNEGIPSTQGQELPETILLNCIFCTLDISASFHNPYQDYVSGWSLEVKPLDKDVDDDVWLRAVDDSMRGRLGNLERMEGSQLVSRLETYVKGYASKDLQQAEWEQLESLVREAGSGQSVEMARRQCGRLEMFGGTSGFRAVFAGYGISFVAHTFYG